MNVIGHRGAAGLAPENSEKGIKAAIKAGVDGIEFDVRSTKNGHLILVHDANLKRTHNLDIIVSDTNLEDIKAKLKLTNQSIATLAQVLDKYTGTPLFIEGKGSNWSNPLAEILKEHSTKNTCTVISFNSRELYEFGEKCPGVKLYILENYNPMDAVNSARFFGFEGIDINYWTLNPLVYWLCQRHHLDIAIYTVNKPIIARVFKILYPKISITTDRPDKLQFLRKTGTRKKNEGKTS